MTFSAKSRRFRRAVAMAVIANPFAGHYVEDILGFSDDLKPLGLSAQEQPSAARDEKQAPIRQPVDAEWERRHADDDFALARKIDGNDLVRAPVREPKTVLVPTWRFTERETTH